MKKWLIQLKRLCWAQVLFVYFVPNFDSTVLFPFKVTTSDVRTLCYSVKEHFVGFPSRAVGVAGLKNKGLGRGGGGGFTFPA